MPIDIHMFGSRSLTTNQKDRVDVLRDAYEEIATILQEYLPEGDEKKLALIRLKESSMWATQSISREVAPYEH